MSGPILIFDSGVGGLTVLKALSARLPKETLLYLGDTARVPYGSKSPATVTGYAIETGDFFARDRELANVLPGDFVALCTAGAYGFVLASNYNSRPRPAEVLVEGASWKFIRARESFEDLVRGE